MSTLIDPQFLRAPVDLSVIAFVPKRVLVVGSCLSEGWARRMKTLPQPCDSDLYMLGRDLPEKPERAIEDYDFQLVQLALRFILPDAAFAKLGQMDSAGHEKLFTHAVTGMRRFLEGAMRWNREHGILTFVFPFITPLQNPIGRLMPRYELSNPVYFIERLNEALAQELKAYQSTYFFDLNEIASFYGRRYVQEDYYSALNHGGYLSNYDFQHDQNRLEPVLKATELYEERVWPIFSASWQELVAMYRSVRQIDLVKMVVIDLDDTLWRGVTAELDLNADSLPTSEGWPKGFWEVLHILKRRGILLAIVSKNDEARVAEFWDRILGRQLKIDDFAIQRINWRPKAENMAEILSFVNLGPQSVVYIDDNPVERAAIKSAFPEIRVLGSNPLLWRRILLWSSETQVPAITTESASRTEMVRAQVVREVDRQTQSRDEFLKSLDVRMNLSVVRDTGHERFSRVLELINKTNQFNTTGRRWTHEDCVAALAEGTVFYTFEVADHYTDYGLVIVMIVKENVLRQFVMSCRVLGLDVEIAAVGQFEDYALKAGFDRVTGLLVETDRNLPCRDLYARCGFEAIEGRWERRTSPLMTVPDHISISVASPSRLVREPA